MMGSGFVVAPRPPKPPPKRTREQVLEERLARAKVRCAEALRLRAEGLTFRAIGERFGVGPARATQLVYNGLWLNKAKLPDTKWIRAATERVKKAKKAARAEAARMAKFMAECEARRARPPEPDPEQVAIVLAHAQQQLWRQFIEPYDCPVANPPPWLRWSVKAGVTYTVSGRFEPEWPTKINQHEEVVR